MNPTRAGDAPERMEREFDQFFLDRLRPAVETVQARKKSALKYAIIAGVGFFLAFFGMAYLYTAPYLGTLEQREFSVWPLLLLLPATMGVIAFSMAYILLLRSAVADFRASLVERLAEFIDPGMVYEGNRRMEEAELAESGLFGRGRVRSGADYFRGRDGPARYALCEVRWEQPAAADPAGAAGNGGETGEGGKPEGNKGDGGGKRGKGRILTGIFYSARFDRPFRAEASIVIDADSGWPEGLMAGRLLPSGNRRDVRLSLSRKGDRLFLALLGENAGPGAPALLDDFDIGNCREFCRDAGFCLELARTMERDATLWE